MPEETTYEFFARKAREQKELARDKEAFEAEVKEEYARLKQLTDHMTVQNRKALAYDIVMMRRRAQVCKRKEEE